MLGKGTSNVIQSHMSALMRYMLYHFWDNEPTSYSIEFSKVLACLSTLAFLMQRRAMRRGLLSLV
uniref:Uncharacterized protein n=1 Tax=Glossina palpalis gambiensis TaxID=67801 RepID=A0A1B0BMA5_9MUSC